MFITSTCVSFLSNRKSADVVHESCLSLCPRQRSQVKPSDCPISAPVASESFVTVFLTTATNKTE